MRRGHAKSGAAVPVESGIICAVTFVHIHFPRSVAVNLTKEPEIVNFPATHYVFVEKHGDFHSIAGQAWKSAHAFVPELSMKNNITGYMSLYKGGAKMYRAGFALSGAPVDLPSGLAYEKFAGGKYARFVLTGPYTELPQASQQVWNTVAEKKISVRDEYAIENYLNDPNVTPEDQLMTEILVPTE
jgi:predicted transcriptional regulator YdeE